MRISDWSSDVCSSDLLDSVDTVRRSFGGGEIERIYNDLTRINPVESTLITVLLDGDNDDVGVNNCYVDYTHIVRHIHLRDCSRTTTGEGCPVRPSKGCPRLRRSYRIPGSSYRSGSNRHQSAGVASSLYSRMF